MTISYLTGDHSPPPDTTQVRGQVLVLLKSGGIPYIIDPRDDITSECGEPVSFPDGVLQILSDPNRWLDSHVTGNNPEGERTRMIVRLFGRNVLNLTQVYVFPAEEDTAQA